MTHSHHRLGNRKSLEEDYVLFSQLDLETPAQLKYKGSYDERARKFLSICADHNAVGLTARSHGAPARMRYLKYWRENQNRGIHKLTQIEEIKEAEAIGLLCQAVFTNINDVEHTLNDLKKADLGISIVVSGIFDEVFNACNNVGLEPHTVIMSLGVWGKTELLPKLPVSEICTMCGHAMISSEHVQDMLEKVLKGLKTPQEASVEIGLHCTDNIFNTERALNIINDYASSHKNLNNKSLE